MPEQPLRWRANVLFRHPPHVPAAERAAPGAAHDGLGELRSPRTPSPPAPLPRCGRGVVREGGIVDSRRIAAATLIPPSAPRVGAEGDRGKVRAATSFRSRSRTPRIGLTLVLHVGYNSYPDN